MDLIAPTVPVTGLKKPVEFQVLRVPDHFTKADFSTHRKPDFKGIISPDKNMVTASEIQYFDPDNLPARFLCFYPEPDTLINGVASFTLTAPRTSSTHRSPMPGPCMPQTRTSDSVLIINCPA